MATFSEIFKALRKDKQLTQEQVAEIFGVSPQAISRWENATSYPDITLLPNIAAYFETTVDDLLGVRKTVKKQSAMRKRKPPTSSTMRWRKPKQREKKR